MSRTYNTRDLALAAVLVLNKHEITRVDAGNNGTATIHFEDNDEVKALVDEYFTRNMKVEPKQFSFAIKDVKQALWEARNGGQGGGNRY